MSFHVFARKVHWEKRILQGGPSSGGSSTSTTELPSYAQPLAQQIVSTGTNLSQQAIPTYQNQTYAPTNSTQTNAIQGMSNLSNNSAGGQVSNSVTSMANNGGNNYGTQGSPTASATYDQYANAQNPYAAATVNAANQQTTQAFNNNAMNLNANFSQSGAFGGSAYQNAMNDQNKTLGTALANNSANIYSNVYNTAANAAATNSTLGTSASLANASNQLQTNALNSSNYNTAQGRVLSSAAAATGLDSDALNLYNGAYTGGTALQTNAQNADNAAYQSWYQTAMQPYEQQGIAESALSGALGNGAQGISSSTQSANPLGLAIGGTTAATGLLSSLSSSGYL